MSNIHYMHAGDVPRVKGEPNFALVKMLTEVLRMAESGQLKNYVGTGFTWDGFRLATWGCVEGEDVYQMLGALSWLEHEYVNRTVGESDGHTE
jgi:hypothetical protein